VTVSVLTTLGGLLADRTRAGALVALMDGRARTAGELARLTQVAPSTMSGHLARLAEAGLVEIVSQGRHRYVRIADDEVGLLLEQLCGLDLPATAGPLSRAPADLRFARSCYDHLAGELGVRLHEHLLARGDLAGARDGLHVTDAGRRLFAELGVPIPEPVGRRPVVRPCLDWTERRDHLGGALAAGLLRTLLDRGWLRHGRRPRSLLVTAPGRRAFGDRFGLVL
jgi:DNA-binding transcriptional ArsR family regulator